MIAFHVEGGMPYMVPLTLMLILNVVLAVIEFIKRARHSGYGFERIGMIRQIALLALVWGIFSTVVGFFQAFSDLSKSGDTIPFNYIMGGLKVALITALYGMVIFIISMAMIIIMRVVKGSD